MTKRLAIVLFLALFTPDPSVGQALEKGLEGHVARHFNAETRCEGGKPVVSVSERANDQTMEHEQIHVRQMRINCDSVWNVWLASPEKRMRAEAQAECMAMIHVNIPAADRQKKIIEYSRFYAQFWNAFNFGEYYAFYEEFCDLTPSTTVGN